MSAASNLNDTPLHYASNHSKLDIAYKLLDNGADLFARNSSGRTPVDVAGNPNVKISLLTHQLGTVSRQLGTVSRENTQLSQELRDVKNFVMATTFGNKTDRRRRISSTSTTTTTTTSDEDEEVWV
jgi:ankyrin repeat protein